MDAYRARERRRRAANQANSIRRRCVPSSAKELLESRDASRERRNEASYAAAFVPEASVADAREATAEMIELARSFVGD